MVLPKKMYDTMKWIAQYFLPALATFYFALAQTWGWDHSGEVVATITALDTFLGVLLGISSAAYVKSDSDVDGHILVEHSDDEDQPLKMSFELKDLGKPQAMRKGDKLTFKVDGP